MTFKGLGCEGYRLPTEAEWEYAVKGKSMHGLDGKKIKIDGPEQTSSVLEAHAWYNQNSAVTYEGGIPCLVDGMTCGTQKSKQKAANKNGLYDVLGNVDEWVWDWKGAYPGVDSKDPTGTAQGDLRVIRGGSWVKPIKSCRPTTRAGSFPAYRYHTIGFRAARTMH